MTRCSPVGRSSCARPAKATALCHMEPNPRPARLAAAAGGHSLMTTTDIHREDGKVVGYVEDAVFHKAVTEKHHLLTSPPGWAFDLTTLVQAKAAGAVSVELHAKDTGRTYSTTIAQIERYGRHFDRGHGAQVVLSLHRWKLDDPAQPRLWVEPSARGGRNV